jgi:copper(I)-binding protein
MTCDAWLEAVSANLDGELPEHEQRRLNGHLSVCPACRDTSAALAAQHRALRLRPAEAVPDRTEAIVAAASAGGRPARRHLALAGGVAAAALVAGVAVVAPSEAPRPDIDVTDVRISKGQVGGVTAMYLYVGNEGGEDRLVGVATPVADRAELHLLDERDGLRLMRTVDALTVPAAGAAELAPGGSHLMLVGLRKNLSPGDNVPITVEFARSGRVELTGVVASPDDLVS